MRILLIATLSVGACYSPKFQEGLPCSETRQCPDGQTCAADDRCYSTDPGGDGGISGGALLSALEITAGTLEPSFDPAVTNYTVSLGLGPSEVRVRPTASVEAGTEITVNALVTMSGQQSPVLAIGLGDNVIDIVVTAADSSQATYSIRVSRGAALAQAAFVKASNADPFDLFGGANDDQVGGTVAIDGDILVVSAASEDSNASDINGNQADNSVNATGAVYVFVREGEQWTQEAYLKASNPDQNDRFGTALAVSGNTVAVGVPSESSAATSINGNQNDNTANDAGAVYVFRRNGSTWSQEAYIKASNAEAGDNFGAQVALSGNTLAVAAPGESSDAIGVNGVQSNNLADDSGAVYVFTRAGSAWSQQAYLKPSNTQPTLQFGGSTASTSGRGLALFGDTLAAGAVNEPSSATGVNGNEADTSAPRAGAVYVFRRTGATWEQEAYVKPTNTQSEDKFGWALALGEDTLAVSSPFEDSNATGVDGSQSDESLESAGAVYVFSRDGSTWSQEAYVKASNTGIDDQFGQALALTSGGLIVGANFEDSNALGLGGDQQNNAASNSGAAYLFGRIGSTWSPVGYLKASNTEAEDNFAVALAITDSSLVIVAPREDSGAAAGEADNSASAAGAAYIFK